jgi:hypothetical protein
MHEKLVLVLHLVCKSPAANAPELAPHLLSSGGVCSKDRVAAGTKKHTTIIMLANSINCSLQWLVYVSTFLTLRNAQHQRMHENSWSSQTSSENCSQMLCCHTRTPDYRPVK